MLRGRLLRAVILAVLLPFLFTGCQDLFTTSAFTWAATDLSDMSKDQKVAYAEDVAKTGNATAMAEAFEALQADLPADAADDPDLYLLASDLAMGGSGLPGTLTEAIEIFASGDEITDPQAQLEALIANIDEAILTDSVNLFSQVSAVDGMEDEITESQYTNAAVAQLFIIVQGVDLESPTVETDITGDPAFAQVEEWATLGGFDQDSIIGLLSGGE